MTVIEQVTIDGVEYKLFINDRGPAVRVKDVDANEVVTIINYPNHKMAQGAYVAATEYARTMV